MESIRKFFVEIFSRQASGECNQVAINSYAYAVSANPDAVINGGFVSFQFPQLWNVANRFGIFDRKNGLLDILFKCFICNIYEVARICFFKTGFHSSKIFITSSRLTYSDLRPSLIRAIAFASLFARRSILWTNHLIRSAMSLQKLASALVGDSMTNASIGKNFNLFDTAKIEDIFKYIPKFLPKFKNYSILSKCFPGGMDSQSKIFAEPSATVAIIPTIATTFPNVQNLFNTFVIHKTVWFLRAAAHRQTNAARIFFNAANLTEIKNIVKKIFADSENRSIFAAQFILKGGFVRLLSASGIFCACMFQIYGATPVVNCNGTPALEVNCSGSVALFFHATKQTNLSVMQFAENSCLNGQSTSESNRIAHDTSITSVSYTYEGNAIKFIVNGNVLVNATQMAKPFEKQPVDWLKYQPSKDFLEELVKVRNHTLDNEGKLIKISLADLVIVKKGGLNPGTWFHEDVAIEFARWLSPRFGIWCNDRVKEILQGQITTYPGKMAPTNCAILNCHDTSGNSKQAYLLWGDDTWFQCGRWNGDREIRFKTILSDIGDEDVEVVRYNTEAFYLKNGKWNPSCFLSIPVDKRPKNENALVNCEKAIERYRKAKDEVKVSAEALAEYMNVKC